MEPQLRDGRDERRARGPGGRTRGAPPAPPPPAGRRCSRAGTPRTSPRAPRRLPPVARRSRAARRGPPRAADCSRSTPAAPTAPGRPAQKANTKGRPVVPRPLLARGRGGPRRPRGRAPGRRSASAASATASMSTRLGPIGTYCGLAPEPLAQQDPDERRARPARGVEGHPAHALERPAVEEEDRADRPAAADRDPGHDRVVAEGVLDRGHEAEVHLSRVQASRHARRHLALDPERGIAARGRRPAARR